MITEPKYCVQQDSCPLLLGAIHAKVNAESCLRVAKAEYDGKRQLMNDLYNAAKKCREAQRIAMSNNAQWAQESARRAEAALDGIIAACARPKASVPTSQPDLFEGGREFHHD